MYHVASRFLVPIDRRKDFIAAALEVRRNSLSYDTGTLRFDLIEDETEQDTQHRFYLSEAFQDHSAFHAHSQGPHFRRFFDSIRAFVPPHEEMVRGTQVEEPTRGGTQLCGDGDLAAVDLRRMTRDGSGLRASLVAFPPSTRTHWHVHTGDQILWVVSGEGWLELEGKEPSRLRPGDAVLIEAGRRHWHGATRDSWLKHLAITTGGTGWFEQSPYPAPEFST